MRITIELPDDLMRAVKVRAVERNMKLEEVVADALRAALQSADGVLAEPSDPVQALARRLVFFPDGTVSNTGVVEDPSYFDALEAARAASREDPLRNPYAVA